jgi:hypothetical protein
LTLEVACLLHEQSSRGQELEKRSFSLTQRDKKGQGSCAETSLRELAAIRVIEDRRSAGRLIKGVKRRRNNGGESAERLLFRINFVLIDCFDVFLIFFSPSVDIPGSMMLHILPRVQACRQTPLVSYNNPISALESATS